MMLSDSVSTLFQQSKTNYLVKLPNDSDPNYRSDLLDRLNTNKDFQEDRSRFLKNNPELKYYDAIKEHFNEYNKCFNKDILIFSTQYKEQPTYKVAELFCSQLKGYYLTYGQNLIERAIIQSRD